MSTVVSEKKTGKRERHGYNVNVWIDPRFGPLMTAALAQIRPKTDKTGVVELALERYFRELGLISDPPETAE